MGHGRALSDRFDVKSPRGFRMARLLPSVHSSINQSIFERESSASLKRSVTSSKPTRELNGLQSVFGLLAAVGHRSLVAKTLHVRCMGDLRKGKSSVCALGMSRTVQLWVINSLHPQRWDRQTGVFAVHSGIVALQASDGPADFAAFLTDHASSCCGWWRHWGRLSGFQSFFLTRWSWHGTICFRFAPFPPSLTFSASHSSHGRERTTRSGHAAIAGRAVISSPGSHKTNKETEEEIHQHRVRVYPDKHDC